MDDIFKTTAQTAIMPRNAPPPIEEPEPPPSMPPTDGISGGIAEDIIEHVELANAARVEALENTQELLQAMQAQIDQLAATVEKQTSAITRINAATRLHACPAGSQLADPASLATQPANIGECIAAGICHCEVGYILTAATWQPPA